MPNYSIVSNARFTPFSFDQMVKPFQMYKEYYDKQEEIATSLAEQAAEIGQKANEASDPITYQKYKDYESALSAQSEAMMRQGLNPGSRAGIQALRKRFANDIIPIKDAYNWRLQQIQNQADGRSKGIVYEGDAATTSLDAYMDNPSLIYGSADSNVGYSRVANAAQAIARGLSEAKITGNLDKYTKALLQRAGYETTDVQTAISQAMSDIQGVLNGTASIDGKSGAIVKELLQNEANASGIANWENSNARQEYISKVSPALYNLIGTSQVTPMEDVEARAKLQTSQQKSLALYQSQLSRNNALWEANLKLLPTGFEYRQDAKGKVSVYNSETGKLATQSELRRLGAFTGSNGSSKYPVYDEKNGSLVYSNGSEMKVPKGAADSVKKLKELQSKGIKFTVKHDETSKTFTIVTETGEQFKENYGQKKIDKNLVGDVGVQLKKDVIDTGDIIIGDFENGQLLEEGLKLNGGSAEKRSIKIQNSNHSYLKTAEKGLKGLDGYKSRVLSTNEAAELIYNNAAKIKTSKGTTLNGMTKAQITNLVDNGFKVVVTWRSGLIDNEFVIMPNEVYSKISNDDDYNSIIEMLEKEE